MSVKQEALRAAWRHLRATLPALNSKRAYLAVTKNAMRKEYGPYRRRAEPHGSRQNSIDGGLISLQYVFGVVRESVSRAKPVPRVECQEESRASRFRGNRRKRQ